MESDNKVEAALFSAGRPVRVRELVDATGLGMQEVRDSLKRLEKRYSGGKTALEVAKVGDKYAMQVKKRYTEPALPLSQTDISKPAIKALSLIAYYEPMQQRQLLEMMGDGVYNHLKELRKLGLIREGRDGRYKVLMTTSRFPEYFGFATTDKNRIKKMLSKQAGVTKENKT